MITYDGVTAVCSRCGEVYWAALGHSCRRRAPLAQELAPGPTLQRQPGAGDPTRSWKAGPVQTIMPHLDGHSRRSSSGRCAAPRSHKPGRLSVQAQLASLDRGVIEAAAIASDAIARLDEQDRAWKTWREVNTPAASSSAPASRPALSLVPGTGGGRP